ncbi:DUF5403 family protein [Saccharothrix sp. HUAS TT10]
MNKVISQRPEVLDAVKDAAEKIRAKAQRLLLPHRITGDHKIEMEKNLKEKYGFLDYEISLVGDAAAPLEFGHLHNVSGRWVNGLYIIHRASGLIP